MTTDKNLRYQQNLQGRTISIVVIASVNNDISVLRPMMPKVTKVLAHIRPGEVIEI